MSYRLDNIEILDQSKFTVPIRYSDSIYFKQYPYRITLHTPIGENDTVKSFHVSSLQRSLLSNLRNLTDKFRIKLNRGHKSHQTLIYVKNINDLTTIVNSFTDDIKYISGPLSEDHLNGLQSRTMKYVMRNKLWYGRYNCKVNTYFRRSNSSGRVFLDFDTLKRDFYNFLRPQVKIHAFTSRYYGISFYCDYDEFKAFMPFLKLAYHNQIFRIEKCILIDK